jgi:hypothetical protein
VDEIEKMRARLDAADSTAATLTQAWDAFDLIRAITRRYEDRAGAAFAAYALAAASAVRDRNLLTASPSIPPSRTTPAGDSLGEPADAGKAADALADLASLLSARLMSVAQVATHASDREACELAAVQADSICALLIGE